MRSEIIITDIMINIKLFNTPILCFIFIQFDLSLGGQYQEKPKYTCPLKINSIYPCICVKESNEGIYVKCENTNLATLSVGLQNLAATKLPVKDLFIYRGHFERLYGPLFSKINALYLTIEDTPIRTIEGNVFHGLNKTVERICLTKTQLSDISAFSFGNLGKLKELEIDGHQLTNLQKDLFLSQEIANSLEKLQIVNGYLNDLPIETLSPLRKLKTLDLHGNKLKSLKRNQFKNLRELEVLDISFNEINKIEPQQIADLTKLGWFNVSNNLITELPRGTFARNSVLKVLNLSHNKISRLDVNSFRGMRFLRRLFLTDNNISEIGRGTFGSISKIGTIDLSKNQIKKIEFQMFSQLNYVEMLNLSENNITIIEKNSFKDIYQAAINVSHNALERIESRAFENCVNITVLDLSFNKLTNFSINAFDETTFATEFQISHNNLTSLGQVPLQNMTSIKLLNVSYNSIEVIPKNCFPKLYELHTIDLSHNVISTIFNGVFQTLFSLRNLNISHNVLEEIKSSTFGTLPTILELDVSHNYLKNINRGSLAKMTSLRFLDLRSNFLQNLFQIPISLNTLLLNHNKIQFISANTWPVMNSLIYLDLSNNYLGDSLNEASFNGLIVLQRLLLNNNGMTQPPRDCLSGMSTLQYLHLQENNITTLEKSAFGKLPVLFELNLYKNYITDIRKRAFEGLLQLLTLNLSSNALVNIPNEAFFGLPSLRRLDLRRNYITKLDNKTNGVLDDLLSLEQLDLSYNRINFVTKKTFPSNQYVPYNLKYLDLSFNQMPVLTYDITFGTKKLIKLNLASNQINEIRRGVLSNLTSLMELDLSNNTIKDLESEEHIFDLPKSLKKINLSNNELSKIPFLKFVKEPKLEIIDLQNNRLINFPEIMVDVMRNGTIVLFGGNPLHCTCSVRPLKHYLLQFAEKKKAFQTLKCNSPGYVFDLDVYLVLDEQLQCPTEEKQIYRKEYNELTDVRIRDVTFLNENITISWLAETSKDIADFTVYIRSIENQILYQQEYSYNIRKADIPLTSLGKYENVLQYCEICIVSRNSNGRAGRWFSDQCRKLPKLALKSKGFFNNFKSSKSCTCIDSWQTVFMITQICYFIYKLIFVFI